MRILILAIVIISLFLSFTVMMQETKESFIVETCDDIKASEFQSSTCDPKFRGRTCGLTLRSSCPWKKDVPRILELLPVTATTTTMVPFTINILNQALVNDSSKHAWTDPSAGCDAYNQILFPFSLVALKDLASYITNENDKKSFLEELDDRLKMKTTAAQVIYAPELQCTYSDGPVTSMIEFIDNAYGYKIRLEGNNNYRTTNNGNLKNWIHNSTLTIPKVMVDAMIRVPGNNKMTEYSFVNNICYCRVETLVLT
jgi:hypothetical protein